MKTMPFDDRLKERTSFKALIVTKDQGNAFIRKIEKRSIADLPAGDLIVRVHYSSLNYKDALSATGHAGVTKRFPHTPGIDAAGEVAFCSHEGFSPGDKVIVTGYDLGMNMAGGWGQYIRVPAMWAVPLPRGLTLWESMALGTAGLTAALAVFKLVKAGLKPDNGDILVTGATGGVGSLAVSILAGEGYKVVAATGKSGYDDFLISLGATDVINRDKVTAGAEKALLSERWAGVVDVVGGTTLAAALKSLKYGGLAACCGMAGSQELIINVYPFILRGISLIGIDSAECPRELRRELWQNLAATWKPRGLRRAVTECTLDGLEVNILKILGGGMVGRVVVDMLSS